MAPKYTTKLHNKRIVIFGGTSGVGLCVAEASIEHGASVVTISGSNAARLSTALTHLRSAYPHVASSVIRGQVCDLADTANVERNVARVLRVANGDGEETKEEGEEEEEKEEEEEGKVGKEQEMKRINHVVFTAGDKLSLTHILNASAEDIMRGGPVRYIGGLTVAKLLPRYMELVPDNSYTMTGGTNTRKPGPSWTLLSGWGGAIEGATYGLAVDLRPLRVNMVSLGAVETGMFDSIKPELRESVMDQLRKQTLVGSIASAEDVAEAYLYLMKDRFVTGTILSTDGGRALV